MVEATPIAMIMVNPEGDIVLVNAETERLFGYERHELLDQPIDKLVPERFRGKHPGHRTGFIADSSARLMGADATCFALRKRRKRISGRNWIKSCGKRKEKRSSFVLSLT